MAACGCDLARNTGRDCSWLRSDREYCMLAAEAGGGRGG